MTHEFKHIVETTYKNRHLKHILATVVALDGSSYRKPGVQMLISENGDLTGAVSGGCVEKEVKVQSTSVFRTGMPKVMTYDGRYRLGCEGILYILLEPFKLSDDTYNNFQTALNRRQPIVLQSYFEKAEKTSPDFGSVIRLINNDQFSFRSKFEVPSGLRVFSKTFSALTQLVIFGGEHDAIALCKAATLLGWEVKIVASPRNPLCLESFPGAQQLSHLDPEMPFDFTLDLHTAIVVMNHNFARDLHFLLALQKYQVFYIGVLGAVKRRDRLIFELTELAPNTTPDFIDSLYSPAGINIGAISPEEIAISILSEIIAVQRHKTVPSLRNPKKSIHF